MACPSPGSSSLQLSISASFPHRTAGKKKKLRKKKERKATTISGLQIQQAKSTASNGGTGLLPHRPVSSQSLIYTVHKPCALHNQNEAPLPRNNNVYSCIYPHPHPRVGRGQVREGRKKQTHEDVRGGNRSRSLQRNLIEASASTG